MMRSMYTAVSGLRTHQTKMDVIGNNIANVNTVGFKSSNVTFAEIYAQTLQGATRASDDTGRGGMNPKQIGLGVSLASIDKVMTQGAAQVTDNALDMMINGSSFFILGDDSGKYFTRNGSFRLDAEGNLVSAAGLKVHGWASRIDASGNYYIDKGAGLVPLQINSPQNASSPPNATSNIHLEGNMNLADGTPTPGIVKTMSFYDSLGNKYTLEFSMHTPVATAGNTDWTLDFSTATLTMNGTTNIPLAAGTIPNSTIRFDSNGEFVFVGAAGNDTLALPGAALTTAIQTAGVAATVNSITVNYSNLTQYNSKTTVKVYDDDGYTSGTLQSFSVDANGKVTGLYSNDAEKLLGQIAVANFKNAAGLENAGGSLYTVSPNSGQFNEADADEVGANGGTIMAGALEMSNVDLSYEFTEMITTQRGFQANSRIISVSDDMLQELVNLKR